MIERYRVKEIYRIWEDKNRFKKYLDVEIAVLEALEERGVIPEGTFRTIRKRAKINVERIKEIESRTRHDIIAFVSSIEEQTGKAGKFVHFGLTSSDVIDTAIALLMKETLTVIHSNLSELLNAVVMKAEEEKFTPIVGRTHGIHAEPTTLGLKMLSWASELSRCLDRVKRITDFISYGKISGPVGNYSHLPPEIERIALKKLGLKPEPVATQVVPRDRYIEFIYALTMIGNAIERMATEIRHLQRTEIRELEEPFRKGQRGSSAMPHKRNPIICERLTGMARLLRGYLIPIMENNALWNERDISHSSVERIVLPDASELTVYMIKKAKFVVENLNIYPENMKKNLELTKGLIFSSRVLLHLIEKGYSRDEAYSIVQRNAMKVWKGKGDLLSLLLKDEDVLKVSSVEEIKSLFSIKGMRRVINTIFKRVRKEVERVV